MLLVDVLLSYIGSKGEVTTSLRSIERASERVSKWGPGIRDQERVVGSENDEVGSVLGYA